MKLKIFLLILFFSCSVKINAYAKDLQNNVIYEGAPQLENSTSNITEGEFYHEILEKNRQEHENPDHNGKPWKQRVFRDEIPDDQEISASSSIDDTMNVITKGVGTASVQVNISIPEAFSLTNTIIVQLSNDSTGDIYELGAYYENAYTTHMNIPKGHYTVIAAMVVNDYSGYYTIPTGQKFTVGKKDHSTYKINLKLKNTKSTQSTPETHDIIKKEICEIIKLPPKTVPVHVSFFDTTAYLFIGVLTFIFFLSFFLIKNKNGKKKRTNTF